MIDWLGRSLPNLLQPEPQPVGMTGPVAPDLGLGARVVPNGGPARKSAGSRLAKNIALDA
jgi:hypothetical protein